jgi:hypothetical protein
MSLMEAIVDPPFRGSLLDADHPENGVLIPRLITAGAIRALIDHITLTPGPRRGEIAAKLHGDLGTIRTHPAEAAFQIFAVSPNVTGSLAS